MLQGLNEAGRILAILLFGGVVILELLAYFVFYRWLKLKNALPLMLMFPALLAVTVLVYLSFWLQLKTGF